MVKSCFLLLLLQSGLLFASGTREFNYKSIRGGSTWWVGWNNDGLLDSQQPRILNGSPNPVKVSLKVTYLPDRPFEDKLTTSRKVISLVAESIGAQPETLEFLVLTNTDRTPSRVVLDAKTEEAIDNTSFCANDVCVYRFIINDRSVVMQERIFGNYKRKRIIVSIADKDGHFFEWFARYVRVVTLSATLVKVD